MEDNLNYAEMFEIPVDTLEIHQKKSRKKSEKEQVIGSVNERVNTDDYDSAFSEVITDAPDKRYSTLFTVQYVAVCLLCAAIFLTNIFMPNSAINTLMRSVFIAEALTPTDSRVYTDLTLQPMISELAEDVDVSVSANGVITFTANCSIYPMHDGTVRAVAEENGVCSVEIEYTDRFFAKISGLQTVYAQIGDEVRANIPVGYASGDTEVSVALYNEGVLIQNYTYDEGYVIWTV